jgi:acyl carrier protein
LKILYDSELLNRLDKFEFSQDLRKDLNLDSLNITVILTSIEHEFTTVFEDTVFESVRNLEEIVTLLARDPKIF